MMWVSFKWWLLDLFWSSSSKNPWARKNTAAVRPTGIKLGHKEKWDTDDDEGVEDTITVWKVKQLPLHKRWWGKGGNSCKGTITETVKCVFHHRQRWVLNGIQILVRVSNFPLLEILYATKHSRCNQVMWCMVKAGEGKIETLSWGQACDLMGKSQFDKKKIWASWESRCEADLGPGPNYWE